MFLVVLACLPPEWNGSKVADTDEGGDQWAIQSWVNECTHSVGDVAEDNWRNSLSKGDTEEVDRDDVTLLLLWGGVLNHSDSWTGVGS